jgi:hypothetical protein
MSEPYRAMLVILLLSLPMLWAGQSWLCPRLMPLADYRRRAALWVAMLLTAYLSHDFWLFSVVVSVLLIALAKYEKQPLSLFVFLLFVVPTFPMELPGFLGMRQVFTFTYPRLLSLLILLPAWWVLRQQAGTRRFGNMPTDWFLLAYVLLQLILQLQVDTATNTARFGVYAVLDVLLPYYVASRCLRDEHSSRDVLGCFVFAIALTAPVAVFESLKHWLLYQSLPPHMGLEGWGMGGYLMRGESLRAVGPAGHSLVLGYMMAVAVALYPFVAGKLSNLAKGLLLMILLLGLFAPVSRGPWVGAAAALVVLVVCSPLRWRRAAQLVGFGVPAFGLFLLTPAANQVIDLLPFVGTVDSFNVEYRSRLLEASWTVVQLYPFFGSFDYLSAPEMVAMMQGEGIVDLVNIYVSIALGSGLVGLTLFVCVFGSSGVAVLLKLFKSSLPAEQRALGHVLLATLVGVMVVIGTLSNILTVPVIYWLVVGLSVSYASTQAWSTAAHRSRAHSGAAAASADPRVKPLGLWPLPPAQPRSWAWLSKAWRWQAASVVTRPDKTK